MNRYVESYMQKSNERRVSIQYLYLVFYRVSQQVLDSEKFKIRLWNFESFVKKKIRQIERNSALVS